MIIEYRPEGTEPERLDAGRLRTSEIQIIERTADATWSEVKAGLRQGDVGAMRVVALVIKKRTNPALKLAEFDPWEDELRVLLDARETRAYAEGFMEKYGDQPDELADAFAELRDVTADPEACEAAIADVTAPKDPAPAPVPEETTSPSATA
ncbi:hypothetical protein ACFVGX_36500 [Streptomyces sp. NPDC127113]|uniref:hypothetical protein n=1 Tax=Streptomyces sp. NPDC127113 TaxID=3345365 RepID=UPI003645188C